MNNETTEQISPEVQEMLDAVGTIPNLCVSYSFKYLLHGLEVEAFKGKLEVPNNAVFKDLEEWVKFKDYVDLASKYGNHQTSSAKAIEIYRKALIAILNWNLPATGELWPSGGEVSFEAKHGSYGVQNYIRSVAANALVSGKEVCQHEQAFDDAVDAAKWRALINCARITAVGSAGIIGVLPDKYAHLTINLWTKHEAPSDPVAVSWLEKFVRLAMSIERDRTHPLPEPHFEDVIDHETVDHYDQQIERRQQAADIVTDSHRREARLNAAAATGNIEHYASVINAMIEEDEQAEKTK